MVRGADSRWRRASPAWARLSCRAGTPGSSGDDRGGERRSIGLAEDGCLFQMRRVPAILVSGRKLVGSAQRRWGKALAPARVASSGIRRRDAPGRLSCLAPYRSCREGHPGSLRFLGRCLLGGPVERLSVTGWSEMTGAVCTPGTLLPEERRRWRRRWSGRATGIRPGRFSVERVSGRWGGCSRLGEAVISEMDYGFVSFVGGPFRTRANGQTARPSGGFG